MKKLGLLPSTLVFLFTFTYGAPLSPDEIEKTVYQWSRTFAETVTIAAQKHFNPEHIEQAMIKAIDAFCSALDPHSSFLDSKAYKVLTESTSGEFSGIGIVMDNTRKAKDKFLLVVDTVPDGPSERAGLKPLDKIIEIDEKPLEGMSTEEIATMLKGQRNTTVEVKIMRENQQDLLTFTITRDIIKDQSSLCFYLEDHQIYYLALTMFSETATKQVESLLVQASKKPYRGLIIDLRNNSGGLLSAAIDIAGLFLEKGSLVATTKDRNNKEIERYTTVRNPVAKSSIPIFILVNNYTASAAEILAGFLRTHAETMSSSKGPHPLVFLIGTETFGKGSVQEVIPIGNNCAVKMTTRLYYLPNNTTVQGSGIKPDFVIERTTPIPEQMTWFMKNYGRESALENFIKPPEQTKKEEAKEKKKEPAKPAHMLSSKERSQKRAEQMLETDNQLRQTIALIDMLASAQQHCPQLVRSRSSALSFLGTMFVTDTTFKPCEIKF